MAALREAALGFPDTSESVACKGTAIEKRTVTVRGKAFLFLGATDAMMKLRDSLDEAKKLASKDPAKWKAGAGGWVSIKGLDPEAPPPKFLVRWIGESYGLMSSKDVRRK